MHNYRQEYAQKFNTYPHYVAYWHELTSELQSEAIAKFDGENMVDCVYSLGQINNLNGESERPCIICRRKISRGDDTAARSERTLIMNTVNNWDTTARVNNPERLEI